MVEMEQEPVKHVDISRHLRLLMVNRGLSVGQLAELAGVSKSAMEKYLAGPSSPRATAIVSLAQALDVSADFLLFGDFDLDSQAVLSAARAVVDDLLEELQGDTDTGRRFRELQPGSQEANHFLWGLGLDAAQRIRDRALADKAQWRKSGRRITYP